MDFAHARALTLTHTLTAIWRTGEKKTFIRFGFKLESWLLHKRVPRAADKSFFTFFLFYQEGQEADRLYVRN